jgi:hypothetical protein
MARAWVSAEDALFQPRAFFDAVVPPFPPVFHSRLDELAGMPEGLADGSYSFVAEAIDGVFEFQTFAGGVTFPYISGTSHLVSVDFTAPEPDAASGWAAIAALAGCTRARGRRRSPDGRVGTDYAV